MPSSGQPFVTVPVSLSKLLPRKKETEPVEKDMADLPYTDRELIVQCQQQYEQAAQHGGQEAVDACFRLSWALVHSRAAADVQRGIELAEALLHGEGIEQRDLLYLVCVGKYRQRKYIEARRTLKGLMEVNPEFRQAETLLDACEKEILKDGLVGVGAGVAVLGAVAAVAVAAFRSR